MNRRILIASASLGGGHGRAGQCVAEALGELDPRCAVRCVDLCELSAWWFRALYMRGYLLVVRRVPRLWAFLYRRPPRKGGGTLPPWFLRFALPGYERLVHDFEPGLILSTQITASEATAALRKRGVYHGRTATVVTDFDPHPAWDTGGIDRFLVADEAVAEGFVRAGIPPDHLEATGIPISPLFEGPFDREALRARHGLRQGVPVVLLMGGSLGLGGMAEATRALLRSGRAMDLVVVAGHNARLRRAVEAMSPGVASRLKVFGFVDFVHELMAAADLFVSKPGGLSMTEAATVGVPTLAVAPLPGQELANLRHLLAQGVVECLREGEGLAEAVERLLGDSAGRDALRAAAGRYAHHHSARRLAERLLAMAT